MAVGDVARPEHPSAHLFVNGLKTSTSQMEVVLDAYSHGNTGEVPFVSHWT